MTPRKWIKLAALALMTTYGLYVIAVAVFLNTSLFARVTQMEDTRLTYVRFHGAFSWIPGRLWIQHATVVVSDKNVTIPIRVDRASAHFSLLPFFKKRIEVNRLHVSEVEVDLGMKSAAESAAFVDHYLKIADLNPAHQREAHEALRNKRWTLDFKKVIIETISRVKTGWGQFKGRLELDGGFRIQPKVEVEIYPTILRFVSGMMPSQFSEISGISHVRFHPFQVIDTPGNAVFPYVDLQLDLKARLETLKLINLTLRKLKGYTFESNEGSQITTHIHVKRGHLETGGYFDLEPSRLTFRTPHIHGFGRGKIRWDVDETDGSLLVGRLQDVRVNRKAGGKAGVRQANIRFRLLGNDLAEAFHGLTMRLDFEGLTGQIAEQSKKKKSSLSVEVSGKGRLTGYAGKVSRARKNRLEKTLPQFDLTVPRINIQLPTFPMISGAGDFKVHGKPIAFSAEEVQFPQVEGSVNWTIGNYGKSSSTFAIQNVEHSTTSENTWKGKVKIKMAHTQPLIRAMKDQHEWSGVIESLTTVRNMQADLEFESKEKYSWIRLNDLTSDGSWSAYGTLMKLRNEWKGDFEAKILAVPIGIRLRKENMEVQVFPSTRWYEE